MVVLWLVKMASRARTRPLHELSREELLALRESERSARDARLGELSLVRLARPYMGFPEGLEAVYHFADVVGVAVPTLTFSNGYETTLGRDLPGRLEKVKDLEEEEALDLLESFLSSPDYGRSRRIVT